MNETPFQVIHKICKALGREFSMLPDDGGIASEQLTYIPGPCDDAETIALAFVANVEPRFTACIHLEVPHAVELAESVTDPASGLSIRYIKFFDSGEGEFRERYDMAFA